MGGECVGVGVLCQGSGLDTAEHSPLFVPRVETFGPEPSDFPVPLFISLGCESFALVAFGDSKVPSVPMVAVP